MFRYRNISQKCNSNTFFFLHLHCTRAVNSHTLPCRHRLQRAWQVWCNKTHSIASHRSLKAARVNFKCRIYSGSVKSLMCGLSHTHRLWWQTLMCCLRPLVQYCQGNCRRFNENRANTQLVLSVHLSSCSLVRWDFNRLTKLVPKTPFNGNLYEVQLCYIKM